MYLLHIKRSSYNNTKAHICCHHYHTNHGPATASLHYESKACQVNKGDGIGDRDPFSRVYSSINPYCWSSRMTSRLVRNLPVQTIAMLKNKLYNGVQ